MLGVRDIAAAQRVFTERYGVSSWFTVPDVHFGPEECELRGAPADYTISVTLGYAGGQQLEFVSRAPRRARTARSTRQEGD
ncbi:hypothetical protein OH799_08800 [Nocardia sp. NBC_00881]|uniref:hypothetical protein n=1 Tax=Nocardia sp. NBC_00881 TaxID=2975995 RepID=UPI00386F2AC6|nr:hypothetical protein OH799_08800 [Nocardia sp. NBC_00881]